MQDTDYLDNNATVLMHESTISEMVSWINKGNASSDHRSALTCRAMVETFKNVIGKVCRNTVAPDPEVIITSCGSESNAMVLWSVITQCGTRNNTDTIIENIPHIITTNIEHKSILDHCKYFLENNLARVTFIDPNEYTGEIPIAEIITAIEPTTKLIAIMHGNNETGIINDVYTLGRHIEQYRPDIHYHIDAVQTFGKIDLSAIDAHIDTISVSLHKIGGATGIACIVYTPRDTRKLCPLIFGTQNNGYRGGTMNIPAIGAGLHASRRLFLDEQTSFTDHQQRINRLKRGFVYQLSRINAPCITYRDYLEKYAKLDDNDPTIPRFIIVLLSVPSVKDSTVRYLDTTMLVSLVKRNVSDGRVCNTRIKKVMEDAGVIVSIGSACNTDSKSASHVASSMKVSVPVRRGLIRASMSLYTPERVITKFCDTLLFMISEPSSILVPI